MRKSLLVTLMVCTQAFSATVAANTVDCENTLMNQIHSEEIYHLSSDVVQINNEIIQDEIALLDAKNPPKEELIESIDSITDLSNEIVEQSEAIEQTHPKVSFLDKVKSQFLSTSKSLFSFGKKAFEVTKEKSIVAGTFVAREGKKLFGFLKRQAESLFAKVEDKKEERKRDKEALIAEYKNFQLTNDQFVSDGITYKAKIYRHDNHLSQMMAPANDKEKVLVYYFDENKLYHITPNHKRVRVSPLILRTTTMKDISQITLETNFIKNEGLKKQIIDEKNVLQAQLDTVNSKLSEDLDSAESLIAFHRVGKAIVDLKDKMYKLRKENKAGEATNNMHIASNDNKRDQGTNVNQSQGIATKDGEIIPVFDIEM